MKRLLIALLLPLLASSVMAQTSVWKISKGGNEMYLAGSVHLLRESDYPLPKQFDRTYQKAEKLVFEADIDQLQDPQMAQAMMAQAMIPENKTLADLLSEEVYKALEAEAAKLSLPLANLARFKPSMVIVTMTGLKLQQEGISAKGVDQHFIDKAKADGKELGYLETVEEQIEVLMNMGAGNEDSYVKYSIDEMETMTSAIEELIGTWRDGTSSLMKEQLAEMESEYPEIYESIIVNRNNNWMPQLEGFLQDDVTEYVIVGSLHLHGDDGILEMLKAKGFKIKQLK